MQTRRVRNPPSTFKPGGSAKTGDYATKPDSNKLRKGPRASDSSVRFPQLQHTLTMLDSMASMQLRSGS